MQTAATQSDLLRKYDVPGPRYTSYPTILHWDSVPTPEQWIESVADSLNVAKQQGTGAAIYIHIPYCRSLCTYCGCNSRITTKTSVSQPYLETVLKEWSIYRTRLGTQTQIPLTELHLGGGTPTFLSPSELDQLISGVLRDTVQTADAEFSIESDPRVTTAEHLNVLSRLGFRRLSLGIQDFDPQVQLAVNRIQTEKQVEAVTEQARQAGFNSINYDLIYGLPFQTLNSVEQTIQAVMRLRPDRIAFYAYAHVPWVKPGQRHFTEADLPSGDEKRELYEFGREMLAAAGYREIGMDHFALETDSLWKTSLNGKLHRNFMGYTSRFVTPLIGLGVSSISDSWDMFVQNEKVVENYTTRVEKGELPFFRGHKLDREDRILRRHILNLMTRFETRWDDAELYVPFLGCVDEGLKEFERDGLIEFSKYYCRIKDEGRAFLRNICMAFDARLAQDSSAQRLFSRTI
ncbi:MAG: oxygen-independent coproporphyrinogen III oxidase [Blastocatellia bacterium]|nr:MAG: oxygen-independent coproporphyrinogen III oxidase [Blastocatellia bacterium]